MPSDILDLIHDMKVRHRRFALATVVRTLSVTAAKAGAKAVIEADGTISGGWIGGGCARGAVLRAARAALEDGVPRLVSVQPKDLLDRSGLEPGQARDGIEYSNNLCPSQGTMDIFVEPVLPPPRLVIFGASPVGVTLAELARRLGFEVMVAAALADQTLYGAADRFVDGFTLPADAAEGTLFQVVATQGRGDAAALEAALGHAAPYTAFVGSKRKAEALRRDLAGRGLSPEKLGAFKAPAGLDLGAITPEEIALSILAEITALRRAGQRQPDG